MSATIARPDGKSRCRWCGAAPEFLAYHDTEWGFPVDDDRRLFEKLSLEGFQSGLSWRTILAKRENFRAAFRDFNFDRIARFLPTPPSRLIAFAKRKRRQILTTLADRLLLIRDEAEWFCSAIVKGSENMKEILQINYKFSGPRAEFEQENLPSAEPIAGIPGLRWKIWIINEKTNEAGGIYLFDSEEAVQAFLEGPIIAEMKDDPTLSIKVFDVMEEHTDITRGPVE